MIWNWAEVTAEQVESPTVHGAEMIDHPPGDWPGRNWAKCVPPQTVKKLLGKAVLGWTEHFDQGWLKPDKLSDRRPERRGQPRKPFDRQEGRSQEVPGLGSAEMPLSPVLLGFSQ